MAYYDPMRDKSTLGTQIQQVGGRVASGIGEFIQNNEAYKRIQSQKKDLSTLKSEAFETAKKVVAENGGDASLLKPPLENETYEGYVERVGNQAITILESAKKAPVTPQATQSEAPVVTDALVPSSVEPKMSDIPSVLNTASPIQDSMSMTDPELAQEQAITESIPQASLGATEQSKQIARDYLSKNNIALSPSLQQQTPIDVPPPLSTSAKDTPEDDPYGFDALYKATEQAQKEDEHKMKISLQLQKITDEEYRKQKRDNTKVLLDMKKEYAKDVRAAKEKRDEAWKAILQTGLDQFKAVDANGKEIPVTYENFDKVNLFGERKKQFAPVNPFQYGPGGTKEGDLLLKFNKEVMNLIASKAPPTDWSETEEIDANGNIVKQRYLVPGTQAYKEYTDPESYSRVVYGNPALASLGARLGVPRPNSGAPVGKAGGYAGIGKGK